jgi:hypothetical protein
VISGLKLLTSATVVKEKYFRQVKFTYMLKKFYSSLTVNGIICSLRTLRTITVGS